MGLDFGAYFSDLENTSTIDNVPSKAHPEGKSYTVPNLSAADGLLFQRGVENFDTTDLLGDDAGEVDAEAKLERERARTEANQAWAEFLKDSDGNRISMERKFLGSALDELIADGLSQDAVIFIAQTLMEKLQSGPDMAQMRVDRIVRGEALARSNRAERRAAAKPSASPRKAGSKSKSTSGVSRTPRTRTSTSAQSTTAAKKQPAAKTA